MTDTPKQPEPGIIAKVSGSVREMQLDALKKVGGDESADLAVQSRKAYERGNIKESLALSLQAEGAYLKHALHSLHDTQLGAVKAVGGTQAADLAEQGYQAYKGGHLVDGFKLGVKSELEAAKHIASNVSTAIFGGDDVAKPSGVPATPAKPATKTSLKP